MKDNRAQIDDAKIQFCFSPILVQCRFFLFISVVELVSFVTSLTITHPRYFLRRGRSTTVERLNLLDLT